ncbi:hypothetical protein [Micromonospora sp. NPDC048169]|uniref:hypothetical protein n=1 Tax=Micromonospora sp. NPDC048169 TaxID=3154711 RepID=UPI0033F711CB
MKIVSKAELRKMPPGTLYAEYVEGRAWPQGPTDIFLRDIDYISDFNCTGIGSPEASGTVEMFDRELEMDEHGAEYPVDLCPGREGLYDDSLRYLVWDEADVAAIVSLSAWFHAKQGQWNATGRYRIRRPDGACYEADAEDVHEIARPDDAVERMYEQHQAEWRQV